MVPISVTGVHNCLSNCFITGEEAWAPSALPPHLDFGKPSPAQMRSLSWVLTCICLLLWFPRSTSFICTPILTQTPLMEIPLAGWGWSAYGNLLTRRTYAFFHEWMQKDVKSKNIQMMSVQSFAPVKYREVCLPLSECFYVLSQSLVQLEDPWDFPQETCCPNESSLSNVGRTWGGKTVTLLLRLQQTGQTHQRSLLTLVMSHYWLKLENDKTKIYTERCLKSFKSLLVCLISHCLATILLPVRKWAIEAEVTGVNETFNMPFAGSAPRSPLSLR